MPSDSTSRTLIALVVLGLLAWAVWLIREVLPPFLIALALALLLDPLHDRLQRRGLPRGLAVLLIFSGFLVLFVAVVAYLLPRAIGQIADLVGNSGRYTLALQQAIDNWTGQHPDLLQRLNLPPDVTQLWEQNRDKITGYGQELLVVVLGAVQASAGKFGWIIIVPLVTLYLLMDLNTIKARLHYLVPEAHRDTAADLANRVGGVFTAYVRGLTVICSAYGTVVYLVLALGFRLQYALILGLAAVVLYAIPYLGQLMLLLSACIVAWATSHPGGHIVGIAVALVVVGQIFDQLVTPRYFGRKVGLHPVLGLFALMVGAQLFGLVGMVLAVPVAASIRVVLIQLFPRLAEPLPVIEHG